VLVNPSTGGLVYSADGAVPDADGTHLFRATVDGGRTTIETIDGRSGEVILESGVAGAFDIRVVSGDGDRLALMAPLPDGADPWIPLPRTRTGVVVADPSGAVTPDRYRLVGNFEPEAFSTRGDSLFMIEYVPATAPVAYRVVRLDLASGDVFPVLGPLKTPPERMPGTRYAQVPSPRGDMLFTLYSSEPPGYALGHGADGGGDPIAFVHVLNVRAGWAHCLGLPREFWGEPGTNLAMTASPDGRLVYVVDVPKGVVAVVDARELKVVSTVEVDLGAGGLGAAAAVSADGDRLFVGSTAGGSATIHVLDASTLAAIGSLPVEAPILGLGASPNGGFLYAALGGPDAGARLAAIEVATGALAATVPVDGLTGIAAVGAIEA
jgi:hypothetical protein